MALAGSGRYSSSSCLRGKPFSGHTKDQLPYHVTGAGIGDSKTPVRPQRDPSSPPHTRFRPPVPSPDALTPRGTARSPGLQAALRSLLLLAQYRASPPSLLAQNNSKASASAASRGKPRSNTFRQKERDMIIFLLLFRTRNEVLPL